MIHTTHLVTGTYHVMLLSDEELEMLKKAVSEHTEANVPSENDADDSPIVMEAIKWEQLCQDLGIEGYEFS
jgi:hypothetical protein